MRPKTISAGRSELVNQNNSLFIEESNYGRGFEIDMQTGILWQYINRKITQTNITECHGLEE